MLHQSTHILTLPATHTHKLSRTAFFYHTFSLLYLTCMMFKSDLFCLKHFIFLTLPKVVDLNIPHTVFVNSGN